MENTYYYIQKEQKRTINIKYNNDLIKNHFIQLPKTLFIIPTKYNTETQKYQLNPLSIASTKHFNVLLINKMQQPHPQNYRTTTLKIYITPFGNSTQYQTCLGNELEKFYLHNNFNSIKELSQQLIHHYWSTTFDDSYNIFQNTQIKLSFFNKWKLYTKLNKPFNPLKQIKITHEEYLLQHLNLLPILKPLKIPNELIIP